MLKHAIRAAFVVAAAAAAGAALAQSVMFASADSAHTAEAVAADDGFTTRATGRINVLAVLPDAPLAIALANARLAAGAPPKSVPWSAEQQRDYAATLRARQANVIAAAQGLGAEVQGSLVNAVNGVLLGIDAEHVEALAGLASIARIVPVEDMQTGSLGGTDDYVGATAARTRVPAVDGTGVRIAVLDSGIDWTHFNLGGPGTAAAYDAAYGLRVPPTADNAAGCVPRPENTGTPTYTAKVIGGWDFVGERWPAFSTALEPDPNPIACDSHGTSVADIAAGRSADGTSWLGIAPGAQLYAVKVCSAVSSACSGVAIVQALDWSLDPNGDGNLADAVDVVNMSLGANFGLRENSAVLASQVLARFGVTVVASAGNGGNLPFINGSPASTPEVISVAQTQVAGQFAFPLVTSVTGTVRNTSLQPWSEPLTADITAPLAIDPNTTNGGCNAYATNAFAGRIALIRRGGCAASLKTSNASAAGALAVVIDDNVAAADAVTFGFGGGAAPFRPTLTVTQAVGNQLRAATGEIAATFSFSGRIGLDGSMVASSSRGPNLGFVGIKPDIGAPGASIAARAGTGTGTAAFGGTSGSAPVVSGAAALVLQQYPTLAPHEVKARLMTAADANVVTSATASPPVPAPVSRIGAGELRVLPALDNGTAMWDASAPAATSLSFGYQAASAPRVLRKRVVVRNYTGTARTYSIGTSFRYPADAASGGVALSAPPSITVPANSSGVFNLTMTLNPAGLPVWRNQGVSGGLNVLNGANLGNVEYDGYVTLSSGSERISLPWHVLPRRAHRGEVTGSVTLDPAGNGTATVTNTGGATEAVGEIFALTGTSLALPRSAFPLTGDNELVGDLRAAGVRAVNLGASTSWGGNLGVQFAVSRWDAPSHPRPFRIVIRIDSDANGTDDWQVLASVTNPGAADFRQLGFVQRLFNCTPATNCPAQSYFAVDVDLQSANAIVTIPLSPLYGPAPGAIQPVLSLAQPFRYTVQVVDWYFTGAITDQIDPMTYQLGAPRYLPSGFSFTAGAAPLALGISSPAGGSASSSQTGLMVLWRDGLPGHEVSLVTVR